MIQRDRDGGAGFTSQSYDEQNSGFDFIESQHLDKSNGEEVVYKSVTITFQLLHHGIRIIRKYSDKIKI